MIAGRVVGGSARRPPRRLMAAVLDRDHEGNLVRANDAALADRLEAEVNASVAADRS